MLSNEDIFLATRALNEAADAAARDYAYEDISGEEDFSGQLIGRFKGQVEQLRTPHARWRVAAAVTEAVDGPAIPSVRFSGRQMRSKGPGAEEGWSGADLLFVLEIRSPDYEIRKGVLVQAKRLERGRRMPAAEHVDLRTQCKHMLDLTPASFVFLYATTGLTVISASAVEASQRRDVHHLSQFHETAPIFFSDFLKCWVGDPRFNATDQGSLAVLRSLANARNAMLLRATQGDVD